MKAKDLAQLLELIVRKVVREELKPILSEVKRSKVPLIKETKSKPKPAKDPLDINISDILKEEATVAPSKPKTFVNNPLLNELLNETANDGDWKNMDSTFGANQAQGFNRQAMATSMGYGEQSMIPDTDVDGRPVNMEVLESSGVADALTKDYSALMKAIAVKKGK